MYSVQGTVTVNGHAAIRLDYMTFSIFLGLIALVLGTFKWDTCSVKPFTLHHACIDMLFSQPCAYPSPSPCPATRVETKNFTLGNKSKFRFHNNYSFNIFYKNVCNAFLFLFRLCSVAFLVKKRKFSFNPNCNRCMQDVVPDLLYFLLPSWRE